MLMQVGWVTGPPALMKAVASAHQFITFTVASSLQRAVAYGLGEGVLLLQVSPLQWPARSAAAPCAASQSTEEVARSELAPITRSGERVSGRLAAD